MSSTRDSSTSTAVRASCLVWIRLVSVLCCNCAKNTVVVVCDIHHNTVVHTHSLGTPHSLPSLCCHENKPRDFIKVQEAVALLKKPKKARKAHPLFARGFDEMLTMRVCDVDILH